MSQRRCSCTKKTAAAEPRAIGAKRMSNLRYRDAIRLAAAIARNPNPSIGNERRAPTRLTKKPALMLIATMSSKPRPGCGDCRGASPRLTLPKNADCNESIRPARHTAQVSAPAKQASKSDTKTDFQENVFTFRSARGVEARAVFACGRWRK